jgi:hypothetical protein
MGAAASAILYILSKNGKNKMGVATAVLDFM